MFKDIKKKVDTKQKYYVYLRDTKERLDQVIARYIAEELGTTIEESLIKYEISTKNRQLLLEATSKIVASEIKLTLGKLTSALKAEGIKIQSVIIQ